LKRSQKKQPNYQIVLIRYVFPATRECLIVLSAVKSITRNKYSAIYNAVE
jgi:hypothetical protein